MMYDEQIKLYRRPGMRLTGPLASEFAGVGEHGPVGNFMVQSQSATFTLDWLYGEAIAYSILPTMDLWRAHESDLELQRNSGEERGWLRLEVTSDEAPLGPAKAWAGQTFRVNRLITNAQVGQIVKRAGSRNTDYRRACFALQGGAARTADRTAFLQACSELARGRYATLEADWEGKAKARWSAADELHSIIAEANKALDEEDAVGLP